MITYKADYRLCYAHRVWNPIYSYDGNCRMIHGHTADLGIMATYNTETIVHRDVEIAIDDVCSFMTKNIYSRFLIDYADPMFYTLVSSLYESFAEQCGVDIYAKGFQLFKPIVFTATGMPVASEVNLDAFEKAKNSHIYDILKSYVILDFCPSSDNLCKWFYAIAKYRLNSVGAVIDHVEWSSTSNRKAFYKE